MSDPVAHCDFECRSTVDLKATGVHVYAAHRNTGVWCLAWCIDDAPVQCWLPGEPAPSILLEHIARGGAVMAHNASFELALWNLKLRKDIEPSWPELRLEQTYCTMAQAQALALPAALGQLAEALKLPSKKDTEGKALMMRMMRPRRIEADGSIIWWNEPEKLARLVEYCKQDVEVERAVCKVLPPLSPPERKIWLLDQAINNRGIRLDIPSVSLANSLVDKESAALNDELARLTDGNVTGVSQVAKLAEWLRGNGFPDCHSTTKGEVTAMLATEPADNVARVLTIRQLAGKSSTKKLVAMLACVNADDRARGLFSYHGASTGRWAGRRVQPQNLPRPSYSFEHVSRMIDALHSPRAAETIDLCYGPPIDAVSSCLRSMFVPAPGYSLTAGDFANIEGRVLAWIAGEEWKLKAFADYDAGVGHDLYILAYARAFNVNPAEISKDDPRRQLGKCMELFLGFQGGAGAFSMAAANFGFTILPNPPEGGELVSRPPNSLTASEINDIKKAWRASNPKIKSLWRELEDAALAAIRSPGVVASIPNGKIRYVVAKGFLFCRLPNGRVLSYFRPHITQAKISWINDAGEDVSVVKDAIGFWGVDAVTKQFGPQKTYGGSLCENNVQGVARDILVDAMSRLEAANYPIVMHVHDEIVCEIPDGFGSEDEFESIMCASAPWAAGLPVSAPGVWTGKRYRK